MPLSVDNLPACSITIIVKFQAMFGTLYSKKYAYYLICLYSTQRYSQSMVQVKNITEQRGCHGQVQERSYNCHTRSLSSTAILPPPFIPPLSSVQYIVYHPQTFQIPVQIFSKKSKKKLRY